MISVSVIIPNYNHAPFLQDRIESVLNQTYDDFEVILLDDNSTDDSKAILEKYRTHRKVSHIVYNQTNTGSTFKQWEKGIALAKGDWIWIAESDDVANRFFLEKSIKEGVENNSDIVYCNSIIIDQNGNNCELYGFSNMPSKEAYPMFSSSFTLSGKIFIERWMIHSNFIPNASAVVFKKSNIASDSFNKIKSMKLLGDWLFWFALLQRATFISYISESHNYFRTHSNNVRSNKLNNGITEFPLIVREIKDLDLRNKIIDAYIYIFLNKEFSLSLYEKLVFQLHIISYGKYFLFLKSYLRKINTNRKVL